MSHFTGPSRKVIQIATMPQKESTGRMEQVPAALYALCDDGTMWALNAGTNDWWLEVKAVPQPWDAERGV